jgi:uncharacterized protein (DUF58 family)
MIDLKIFSEDFLRKLELSKFVMRHQVRGSKEGEKSSKDKGGPIDFVTHRSYTPGDEFRYIDWPLYARTGSLFVKEFMKEESLRITLWIDLSPSMDFGMVSKAVFASQLAASLAYVGLASSDRIRLFIPKEKGYTISPEYFGTGAFLEVLDLLSSHTVLSGPLDIKGMWKIFQGIAPVGGQLVILSDLWGWEEISDEIRTLCTSDVHLSLIHILAPEEVSPGFRGKIRLIDKEFGGYLERYIADQELAEYDKLLKAHLAWWRDFALCTRSGYMFTTSDRPLQDAILIGLREAKILE